MIAPTESRWQLCPKCCRGRACQRHQWRHQPSSRSRFPPGLPRPVEPCGPDSATDGGVGLDAARPRRRQSRLAPDSAPGRGSGRRPLRAARARGSGKGTFENGDVTGRCADSSYLSARPPSCIDASAGGCHCLGRPTRVRRRTTRADGPSRIAAPSAEPAAAPSSLPPQDARNTCSVAMLYGAGRYIESARSFCEPMRHSPSPRSCSSMRCLRKGRRPFRRRGLLLPFLADDPQAENATSSMRVSTDCVSCRARDASSPQRALPGARAPIRQHARRSRGGARPAAEMSSSSLRSRQRLLPVLLSVQTTPSDATPGQRPAGNVCNRGTGPVHADLRPVSYVVEVQPPSNDISPPITSTPPS